MKKARRKEEFWVPSIKQTLGALVLSAWLTMPTAQHKEKPLPDGTPEQQIEKLVEEGDTDRVLELIIKEEKKREEYPQYKLPDHIQLYAIISRVNSIGAWDAYWQTDDYKKQVKDVTRRFEDIINNFEQQPIETVYLLRMQTKRINAESEKEFVSRLDRACKANDQAKAGRFFMSIIKGNHEQAYQDLTTAMRYIPKEDTEQYIKNFFRLTEYSYKQSEEHKAYLEYAKEKDNSAIDLFTEAAKMYENDFKLFFTALSALDDKYTLEQFTAPPIEVTLERYQKAIKNLQ